MTLFYVHRLCILAASAMVWAFALCVAGCSAVEPVDDTRQTEQSYLELDVEPADAKIYLDGDFRGRIDRWQNGVVPLEPGDRRLELRADGYISQRFDLEVERGRWLTLTVALQPEISVPAPDGESNSRDDGDSDGSPPVPEPPPQLQ